MAVTSDDHSFILPAKTHPCPRRITDRRNHRAGLQMLFRTQCRSLGHQLRDHTPSRRYRKHTFSCFLDLKLNTISLKHSIVNRISPPPPYLLFVRAICFSDSGRYVFQTGQVTAHTLLVTKNTARTTWQIQLDRILRTLPVAVETGIGMCGSPNTDYRQSYQ